MEFFVVRWFPARFGLHNVQPKRKVSGIQHSNGPAWSASVPQLGKACSVRLSVRLSLCPSASVRGASCCELRECRVPPYAVVHNSCRSAAWRLKNPIWIALATCERRVFGCLCLCHCLCCPGNAWNKGSNRSNNNNNSNSYVSNYNWRNCNCPCHIVATWRVHSSGLLFGVAATLLLLLLLLPGWLSLLLTCISLLRSLFLSLSHCVDLYRFAWFCGCWRHPSEAMSVHAVSNGLCCILSGNTSNAAAAAIW